MLLALLLVWALTGTAQADHEDDGIYEIPAIAMWPDPHLTVLVVPPTHGPILNESGLFGGGSATSELTPFTNTYLKAIEDAIAAWDEAIDTLGADWLKQAYKVDVYVAGRDTVPPAVLADPDILVFSDEESLGSLGTAIRVTPCLVRMAKSLILSFSYADMYNITGQEFGHCLGLQHVGSQGGVDPTSDLKHPEHDIMNGFYTHFVGSADTHLHCISNLDMLGLEFIFSRSNEHPLPTAGEGGLLYLAANAYGDTCEPPPTDWREAGSNPLPGEDNFRPDESDPTLRSVIKEPRHGQRLAAARFTEVSGTASVEKGEITFVEIALAKKNGSRCDWWQPDESDFRTRACSKPIWFEASGAEEWEWSTRYVFPAGRYRAMSVAYSAGRGESCCELGRNLVEFQLR